MIPFAFGDENVGSSSSIVIDGSSYRGEIFCKGDDTATGSAYAKEATGDEIWFGNSSANVTFLGLQLLVLSIFLLFRFHGREASSR